ncbi:MAG: endonuclease/exonuclease/phosphatase family metal-dependent hydrolase [Candidatus Paceibacteria bacterium]|jgi:endonuclease/exonuclease/phosphatase family metal-dependent hydrolase
MLPLRSLLLLVLVAACSTVKDPVQEARPLRVLAYNIKHGLGMDGKLDLERVAQLIQSFDPDIVTLQEVDNGCSRSGGVQQAAWLAEACGMYSAFGAFMPYQGGEYGMAVLSRHPILDSHNLRLPDGSEPRTALGIRVATTQGELIVCGIHLYNTEIERMQQATVLTDHFAEANCPVILAGDFNSEPGSVVMEYLVQNWTLIPKTGDPLTFPADVPDREIDFCWVHHGTIVTDAFLRVIDEKVISDHRPLLLEIRLR